MLDKIPDSVLNVYKSFNDSEFSKDVIIIHPDYLRSLSNAEKFKFDYYEIINLEVQYFSYKLYTSVYLPFVYLNTPVKLWKF